MAVLSVRDFDDTLMSMIKSGAALKRVNIKDHVENIIRMGLSLELKELEKQTPKTRKR